MNREEVFARDAWRCVYCGETFAGAELTVDHVQPRVRGGDRSGGNLVTACGGCNVAKGHRRLAEFLREDPVRRANFFRLATAVWPRHLRTLAEELGSGGTRDGRRDGREAGADARWNFAGPTGYHPRRTNVEEGE